GLRSKKIGAEQIQSGLGCEKRLRHGRRGLRRIRQPESDADDSGADNPSLRISDRRNETRRAVEGREGGQRSCLCDRNARRAHHPTASRSFPFMPCPPAVSSGGRSRSAKITTS